MASESERAAADDDTVVVDPKGRAQSEDVTQAGDQWPVSDLYYVGPDEDAPSEHAARDVPPEGDAVVVTAATGAAAKRRFPPDPGIGVLLALLGVAAALVLGAVLVGLDGDDPATSAQPTEPPPTTTTTPTETTPSAQAPTRVEVAEVEGMSLAEATEALEAQGLRVRVTRSRSEQPRGTVLNQAPAAGSEIARRTVVALVVSAGPLEQPQSPARVDVPGVVGLSASEAVSALREAGLEARIRQVTSSEPRGTVVEQTPAEGTDVADGSTVRLEVAKSRPPVVRIQVPDVVGTTAAAARSELRSAGLRVKTTTAVSQEPAGTVIEQSPRAGADVKKGATVRLMVSAGPAKIDVPDVSGLDEAAARTELERAGFVVRVTDESVTDPAQDGIVLRQTPAGGSGAEDGATVTIVVGRVG